MTKRPLPPVHPGKVFLEEFLKPRLLSLNRLAIRIGVARRRINEIVLGKRPVIADTALRLARYLDTTPHFWLGLRAEYDLDVVAEEMGDRLDIEVLPHARGERTDIAPPPFPNSLPQPLRFSSSTRNLL